MNIDYACPNCRKARGVKKIIDGNFSVYFCSRCGNGFTLPVPKNPEKYYPENYWESPGIIGKIKTDVFSIFQRRRVYWITKALSHGAILDVGSGEAAFAKSLPQKYRLVSIEPQGSRVENKEVLKKDFLTWNTGNKFDGICFWESLEHTSQPQKYLETANRLLNKNSKIFIEFPRFNSLESKLFGKNWFHLDIPRHLALLTDDGVAKLLDRSGFNNIKVVSVPAFEYAPWGFAASLLNLFGYDMTASAKKSGKYLILFLLLPIFAISIIIELFLWLVGESPIGLATAEKK
jgi:hypothetical protein